MLHDTARTSVYRLVMLAWLVGVLGSAGLMAWSLVEERGNREEQARRETENVTRVLEEHALALISKIDQVLVDVQGYLEVDAARRSTSSLIGQGETLHELLKKRIATIAEAEVIHIADAAGDYSDSSLDLVPAINVSDRAFFEQHQINATAGLVFSQPLLSRTLGVWVITLSRRINAPDGSFGGIVNVIVPLDNIAKFYASIDMGPHGAVLMRDSEMRLLARYPALEANMGLIMRDHPLAAFQARGVARGVYSEMSPADGIKRIYSFRRVGDSPLYVLAAIAEDDYLAEWWKHLYWYSAAAGLILIASLVLALFARQGMLRQRRAEDELRDHQEHLEQLVVDRTRELQEARQLAESANAAKSDFLSNMSHEIRTPMNAILGLTQIVLDSALNARQRDYLTKVFTASRALLAILNDILDYSKIEADRLDIEAVEFSLEKTLRTMADLFSAQVEAQDLELFIDIAPDVPDALIGDPLRFGQVVNNLVGNAIKFTAHGEIHLRLEVADAAVAAEGAERSLLLRVTVRDTGIGIAPEQVEKLFSPFIQADSSVTRRFGGSGLGLALCKRLVELMGGKISVTSIPGTGSAFVFTLRVRRSEKSSPLPAACHFDALQGLRVLVVDDHETSLAIMRRIFESWHVDVVTARSGEECLERLVAAEAQASGFDFLVLDWKMPGLSGLDTLKAIRERVGAPKRPLAIVMVTAYGRDELLRASQGVEPDAILTKPVIASALLDTLSGLRHAGATTQASSALNALPLDVRPASQRLLGSSILLVEDNAINQQVAYEFLSREGAQVMIANNGEEAVVLVQAQAFAAVLMDLHMPVMDGFEATHRIRQLEVGTDLPIIAMTAAAMPRDRDDCLAAGMNGHVAKPIDPDELVGELTRWIKPLASEQRGPAAAASLAGDLDADSANELDELERLVPGVSIREAWRRFRGNGVLYRRLLYSFAERLRAAGAKLRALRQTADCEAIELEAHSLKGVAGNLGIDSVASSANLLCMKIRSGDTSDLSQRVDALAAQCEAMSLVLDRLAP